MANPFLTLGGIAVGIATAAFGVLAVPGWIGNAQDSAAKNDLHQLTLAQAASVTETGSYAPGVDELATGSVQVTTAAGARIYTGASPDGKASLVVSRSQTGTYFARLSGAARIGSGSSLEAAVTDAGTTITGTSTRVTAEGVQLPPPYQLAEVVFTNYFNDPGTRTDSLVKFGFWPGNTGTNTRGIVEAAWSDSGYAVRATRTSGADSEETIGPRISNPALVEGRTYTVAYDLVTSRAATFTTVTFGGDLQEGFRRLGSSSPTSSIAGVPQRVWLTFEAGPGGNARSTVKWPGQVSGDWSEISNIDLYEGSYDPGRPKVSVYSSTAGGIAMSWLGAANGSHTIAYR